MGSSDRHDRSTTFPWVAARTVQMVYALSDLRGSVLSWYHSGSDAGPVKVSFLKIDDHLYWR